MGDKRTEELRTQYEEAVVALFMDEYAQEHGKQLLAEFEEAQKNGAIPKISDELDRKCRDQIQKHFRQRRRLQRRKQLIRRVGQIAASLLLVIGLSATLIVSVDAFREPVLNFFLEQQKHSSTIGFDNHGNEIPGTQEQGDPNEKITPLSGLLPGDYKLEQYYKKNNGTFYVYYKNSDQASVVLQTIRSEALIGYDSENAEVKPIKILSYEGILIEKNGYTLIWYNTAQQRTYQFAASKLMLDEVWQIAEEIVINCGEVE